MMCAFSVYKREGYAIPFSDKRNPYLHDSMTNYLTCNLVTGDSKYLQLSRKRVFFLVSKLKINQIVRQFVKKHFVRVGWGFIWIHISNQ